MKRMKVSALGKRVLSMLLVVMMLTTQFAGVAPVLAAEGDEYTVTFDTDGGSSVAAQTVVEGAKATRPAAPTKNGYTLDDWYLLLDAESGTTSETAYDFDSAVMTDITLKAKWTAKTYSVTLNANGGTVNNGNVAGYAYGTGATLPTDVTRNGYDFGGWYDNAELTGTAVTVIGTDETGAKEYWASWTPANYTVTLNTNGGTINSGEVTGYTYGTKVTLPTDVTRTNYSFDGWFDGDTKVTEISATDYGNKTYEAKWTGDEYAVVLNTNEGTVNSGNVTAYTYGTGATLPTDVTRNGYDFGGWYDNAELTGTAVTVIGTDETGAKEYWASWTPANYTVTMNTNGGTINSDEVTGYTYGAGATLPTDVTRTGYTFDGWYEGATKVEEISATDFGNKEYQAKWTANTYSVTLNANGGTVNSGDIDGYTYGIGATLPTDVTRDGYDFGGWYDNAELTGAVVTAIGTDEAGAKEYWADWTEASYTVTLNANGGTINSGAVTGYTFGTGAALPTDVTRTGYTFDGWYEGATKVEEISATDFGNKEYQAKWTAESYEVKLNTNGGTINSGAVIEYTYGIGATLPTDVTRDGYDFGGWYDNVELTGTAVTAIGAEEINAKEYWANWILRGDNYSVKTEDGIAYTQKWTNQTVTITPGEPAVSVSISTDDGDSWGEWAESISFDADTEQTVKIRVSDTADGTGHVTEAEDEIAIKVDKTNPVITQKFSAAGDNSAAFVVEDGVYRTGTGATIQIRVAEEHLDANWADDVVIKLVDTSDNSVVETISSDSQIWATDAGEQYLDVSFITELTDQGIYRVEVSGVKDSAENPQEDFEPVVFQYDNTPPAVFVERSNGYFHAEERDGYYYHGDITFTMKIVDENLLLGEDNIPKNVTYSVKKDGVLLDSYTLPAFDAVEGEENSYIAEVMIPKTEGEGEYCVSLEVSDRLHSVSAVSDQNRLDLTAPRLTGTLAESYAETDTLELAVAFADDSIGVNEGSGVNATYYYVVADAGFDADVLKVNGRNAATEAEEYSRILVFTSDEEFRGTVYFYAVDNATNNGEGLASPHQVSCSINIDGKAPRVNITDPTEGEISGIIGSDGTRYSSGEEVFTILVEDENISDPNTNDNMTVSATRGGEPVDAGENTYTISNWLPMEKGWKATVTVHAPVDHSNDGKYAVTVTAVDDCGNANRNEDGTIIPESSNVLVIDTTPIVPVITEFKTKPSNDAVIDGIYYSCTDVVYELSIEDTNIQLTADGKQPLETEGVLDIFLTTDGGTPVKINTGDRSDEAYALTKWVPNGDEATATKWTAELTIKAVDTAKVKYGVELKATDKARTAASSDTSTPLVIDTTPVIADITEFKTAPSNAVTIDGIYYSYTDVIYTLSIEDANIELTADGTQPLESEGVLDVYLTTDDGTPVKINTGTRSGDAYELTTWTQDDTNLNKWTAELTIKAIDIAKVKYDVELKVTDKARTAASSDTSTPLVIDTTPVIVDITEFKTAPSNTVTIDGIYYSYTDVIYTLSIEDANIQLTDDGKQPLEAEGVLDVYLTTDDGTPEKINTGTRSGDAYELTTWTRDNKNLNKWTAELTIKAIDIENVKYGVTLKATDSACTETSSKASTPLVIDTTPVLITVFKPIGVSGNSGSVYSDTDTYYSNVAVKYELELKDKNIQLNAEGQPVAEVLLKTNNSDFIALAAGETSVYKLTSWTQDGTNPDKWTAELTIYAPANMQQKTFAVRVNATDKTDFNTDKAKEITGPNEGSTEHVSKQTKPLVIDSVAPVVSISAPDGNTNAQTVDGVTTYYSSEQVTYTLTVSDPDIVALNGDGSGLGDTKVEVQLIIDDNAPVTLAPGKSADGAFEFVGWSEDDSVADTWKATVIFYALDDIDHQEYQILLSAVDRAANSTGAMPSTVSEASEDEGRTSRRSYPLVMDTAAPAVTIDKPTIGGETAHTDKNNNYFVGIGETMKVHVSVKDCSITYDETEGDFTLGGIEIRILDSEEKDRTADYGEYSVSGWKQEGSEISFDLTFTAKEDIDSDDLNIRVYAFDGTYNGDCDDVASGTNKKGLSASESSVSEYNGGFITPDGRRPEIDFVDPKGNNDSAYNGDFYANTTSAVQGNAGYCEFKAAGNTILEVTISAEDRNIDFDDPAHDKDYSVQVYRYDTLEAARAADFADEHAVATFSENGWKAENGVWKNTVTIGKEAVEGYYVIMAAVFDKAVNDNTRNTAIAEESILADDTTAPIITASQPTNITPETGAFNNKTVYYTTSAKLYGDASMTATFTVKDWNKDGSTYNDLAINDSTAKVTVYRYANEDGENRSEAENAVQQLVGNWVENESNGSLDGSWSVKVDIGKADDGIYQVEIIVTDLAGNTTTYNSDYYVIDNTSPTAQIISSGDAAFKTTTWTVEDDRSGDSSKKIGDVFVRLWTSILDSFGFSERFSQKRIDTVLQWRDGSDSFLNQYNGLDKVEYGRYYYPDNEGRPYTTWEQLDGLDSGFWTTVTATEKNADGFYSAGIPADVSDGSNDSKFIVYMRVCDKAGNYTYLSSNGMIVENEVPVGAADTTKPDIRVTIPNANGGFADVHDREVGLTIDVVEKPDLIFSGINTVTYTSGDGHNGTVYPASGSMTTQDYGTEYDGLYGTGEQTVVLSVPDNYESDQVWFRVYASDNSQNENNAEYLNLNIDAHTPEATISYDNNTAYNSKFFNQPRTATIVVKEMNFDPNNTTVTTQGSVSGWSTGTGPLAEDRATVSYTADGDYTLAFQTTDKAGHTLREGDSRLVYEGVATQDFTLDMTKPTVTITFRDAAGNVIPDGGYADSTVTATITITEHNFDESSATQGLTVTRDGQSYPVNVSWNHNGDIHTATLSFDEVEGAEYAFNISFVDLANNQCDPFTETGFFVDTKAPTIEVSGIQIDSANKDIKDGQISITITDKYYDPDQVKLTLVGAANGAVPGFYTANPAQLLGDGETWSATYVFNHLDKDDIYTLTISATDRSGNTNTVMQVIDSAAETDALKFSLNREGSTYAVDEGTKALLDGYYTNGLEDDIIVTVVNVDKLAEEGGLSIVVVRDLIESITLVEGKDYEIVEVEEITGGYRYTIRIFKEVFAEDGAYSVLISTTDEAGNISRNDTAFDADHEKLLNFYLDTQDPVIKLDNLEKGKTYPRNDQDESAFRDGKYQAASISVSDQTLDRVVVTIKYKNGEPDVFTWSGEAIEEAGTTFTQELSERYAIGEGMDSTIQIEAVDKAGNVMYLSYQEGAAGEKVPTDDYSFTVSTNAFVRFYANKGLFFGSIGGVVVLAAGATGLVLGKKKKKAEETV